MRSLVVLLLLAVPAAADPPLAEKFLHAGQLAVGEQTLDRTLAANPTDDQLRFGLGLIQLVQGVERLGQSLYEYGAKAEHSSLPFVRLPVPANPDPNAITYKKFRTLIDDFRRDLEKAEATLAKITDDRVKLTLRLADIKLDLDGDGKPTDRFVELLRQTLGGNPEFLAKNRDFRVSFDRGDVAWFRSYCHLLMGLADIMLAVDLETEFYANYQAFFPKVKPAEKVEPRNNGWVLKIRFAEPSRLGRVRLHLLQVAKLNRETWRFVRAETDNDDEWLPNAKQTSVVGLPVRDEMIDRWLAFMGELEAVLEGKTLIPVSIYLDTQGKDLNLKKVLDDPPAVLDVVKVMNKGIDAAYLEKGPAANMDVLFNAARVFDGPMGGLYMAYFN
jgi:hypothetical protein